MEEKDSKRNYLIRHQSIVFYEIDIKKRFISASTELELCCSINADVKTVTLNARQLSVGNVYLNDVVQLSYNYSNPFQDMKINEQTNNLIDLRLKRQEVETNTTASLNRGELTIYLPKVFNSKLAKERRKNLEIRMKMIEKMRKKYGNVSELSELLNYPPDSYIFTITIYYTIDSPTSGIKFIHDRNYLPKENEEKEEEENNDDDDDDEMKDDNSDEPLNNHSHVYTYNNNLIFSSREWLPCIDGNLVGSQCLWSMECHTQTFASTFIASGNLEVLSKFQESRKSLTTLSHIQRSGVDNIYFERRRYNMKDIILLETSERERFIPQEDDDLFENLLRKAARKKKIEKKLRELKMKKKSSKAIELAIKKKHKNKKNSKMNKKDKIIKKNLSEKRMKIKLKRLKKKKKKSIYIERKVRIIRYHLGQITSAPYIGFVYGFNYSHIINDNMKELSAWCPSELVLLAQQLNVQQLDISPIFGFFEKLLSNIYPFWNYKQVYVRGLGTNQSKENRCTSNDCMFSDVRSDGNYHNEYYSNNECNNEWMRRDPCQHMSIYAALVIYDIESLHATTVIESVYETRRKNAIAIASQFILCFLSYEIDCDWFLTVGLTEYFAWLYLEEEFGKNFYNRLVHHYNDLICEEQIVRQRSIQLTTYKSMKKNELEILVINRLWTPIDCVVRRIKSALIIRILSEKIGRSNFFEIISRLMTLRNTSSSNRCCVQPTVLDMKKKLKYITKFQTMSMIENNPHGFILNLRIFFNIGTKICSKNVEQILRPYLNYDGVVYLVIDGKYNRRRNVFEIEIRQPGIASNNSNETENNRRKRNKENNNNQENEMLIKSNRYFLPFRGQLQFCFAELDRTFERSMIVEGQHLTRIDYSPHMKPGRRTKKRIAMKIGSDKVGESEAYDSPVLWFRADPNLSLIRRIECTQPFHQWQLMLRHLVDAEAQLESIEGLAMKLLDNPTPYLTVRNYSTFTDEIKNILQLLVEIITNRRVFVDVRIRAVQFLYLLQNDFSLRKSGKSENINLIFVKLFQKLFMNEEVIYDEKYVKQIFYPTGDDIFQFFQECTRRKGKIIQENRDELMTNDVKEKDEKNNEIKLRSDEKTIKKFLPRCNNFVHIPEYLLLKEMVTLLGLERLSRMDIESSEAYRNIKTHLESKKFDGKRTYNKIKHMFDDVDFLNENSNTQEKCAGFTSIDSQELLLDIVRYNFNHFNHFIDDYYLATIINSIGYSLPKYDFFKGRNRSRRNNSSHSISNQFMSIENRLNLRKCDSLFGLERSLMNQSDHPKIPKKFSKTVYHLIQYVLHHLNIRQKIPSYNGIVVSSCLNGIRKFYELGYETNIHSSLVIFTSYTRNNQSCNVRLMAYDCLVFLLSIQYNTSIIHTLFCLFSSNDHYLASSVIQTMIDYCQDHYQTISSSINRSDMNNRIDENNCRLFRFWKIEKVSQFIQDLFLLIISMIDIQPLIIINQLTELLYSGGKIVTNNRSSLKQFCNVNSSYQTAGDSIKMSSYFRIRSIFCNLNNSKTLENCSINFKYYPYWPSIPPLVSKVKWESDEENKIFVNENIEEFEVEEIDEPLPNLLEEPNCFFYLNQFEKEIDEDGKKKEKVRVREASSSSLPDRYLFEDTKEKRRNHINKSLNYRRVRNHSDIIIPQHRTKLEQRIFILKMVAGILMTRRERFGEVEAEFEKIQIKNGNLSSSDESDDSPPVEKMRPRLIYRPRIPERKSPVIPRPLLPPIPPRLQPKPQITVPSSKPVKSEPCQVDMTAVERERQIEQLRHSLEGDIDFDMDNIPWQLLFEADNQVFNSLCSIASDSQNLCDFFRSKRPLNNAKNNSSEMPPKKFKISQKSYSNIFPKQEQQQQQQQMSNIQNQLNCLQMTSGSSDILMNEKNQINRSNSSQNHLGVNCANQFQSQQNKIVHHQQMGNNNNNNNNVVHQNANIGKNKKINLNFKESEQMRKSQTVNPSTSNLSNSSINKVNASSSNQSNVQPAQQEIDQTTMVVTNMMKLLESPSDFQNLPSNVADLIIGLDPNTWTHQSMDEILRALMPYINTNNEQQQQKQQQTQQKQQQTQQKQTQQQQQQQTQQQQQQNRRRQSQKSQQQNFGNTNVSAGQNLSQRRQKLEKMDQSQKFQNCHQPTTVSQTSKLSGQSSSKRSGNTGRRTSNNRRNNQQKNKVMNLDKVDLKDLLEHFQQGNYADLLQSVNIPNLQQSDNNNLLNESLNSLMNISNLDNNDNNLLEQLLTSPQLNDDQIIKQLVENVDFNTANQEDLLNLISMSYGQQPNQSTSQLNRQQQQQQQQQSSNVIQQRQQQPQQSNILLQQQSKHSNILQQQQSHQSNILHQPQQQQKPDNRDSKNKIFSISKML
ncbi:hypothetical protein SNEBB_001811 [Seison nebaliae]|nr:hypothetical protein SNEBB_001811 [Seison nebaliae]